MIILRRVRFVLTRQRRTHDTMTSKDPEATGGYRCRSTFVVPHDDVAGFVALRSGRTDEGFRACLRAACEGDRRAQVVAAWMLFIRTDRGDNLDVAERWLQDAHLSGGAYGNYATYALAWLKREAGFASEAFRLMSCASKSGFAAAVLDLGRFFENGIGTPVNACMAESQYLHAFRAGHTMAIALLFQLWVHGRRGPLRMIIGRIGHPVAQLVGSLLLAAHRFDAVGLAYNP